MTVLIAASCLPGPAAAAGAWSWPVSGTVITTYKNGSDPYAVGQHRGIDIAAEVGATVHSTVGGAVTYAGNLPDGGTTATVRSDDGKYLVSYLHLSQLAVKRGGSVAAGGVVGRVGTTGKRSATAPHLHFSVRLLSSGAYVDPLPLLAPQVVAQTPAADAPVVAQPIENAAPQAQSKSKAHGRGSAQAHSRARSRAQQRSVTRRRLPEHATSRGAQPKIVHVPASGDNVSVQPQNAAGSARESRASTGKGRVAPPPLPITQARDVNLEMPGRTQLTTDRLSERAGATAPAGPPYRFALILLTIAAIGAIAFRRRRSGQSDFTPPLAHRGDLKSTTRKSNAEVVELRASTRRA